MKRYEKPETLMACRATDGIRMSRKRKNRSPFRVQAEDILKSSCPLFRQECPGATLALPHAGLRSKLVLGVGASLALAALALSLRGAFSATPAALFGLSISHLITAGDFAILAVVLAVGVRRKHPLLLFLGLTQLGLLLYIESAPAHGSAPNPLFFGDALAMILVLIVSIVGSLICAYAIPYMKRHEERLAAQNLGAPFRTRQPRFFATMLFFLGVMNGLVLTNDLLHFYFFFEATALCSFLLISHDGTEIAMANGLRALWMNSLGGLFLLLGIFWFSRTPGSLDIQALIAVAPAAGHLLLPLALVCLAAFTKAAQLPFQSWLLGAMVAPTPVSALLHSSTMVKAGVYLLLRFAPSFAGTSLSLGVALAGAFTFAATAALAIGQSNGKKILAYSTISNLGLIVTCAGVNTPAAIIAGMFLLLFHAVTKGLLFLCVGAIEQRIGSRDVEDMRGLYDRAPTLALLTVLGAIAMILMPFGMLLGKWMSIEAASRNIPVVCLLALGSACTMVYWTRWAGLLLRSEEQERPASPPESVLLYGPLTILCVAALGLGLVAPWTFAKLSLPILRVYNTLPGVETFVLPYAGVGGGLTGQSGGFWVYQLFFVAALGLAGTALFLRRAKKCAYVLPYMAGIQTTRPGEFRGPMEKPVAVRTSNIYLASLCGEEGLTRWVNAGSLALLALLLGRCL
jgi:ech hydrogenase subunit A